MGGVAATGLEDSFCLELSPEELLSWELDMGEGSIADQLTESPCEECLAACHAFWMHYCVSVSVDMGRDRLLAALGHAVKQHHQFLSRKVRERVSQSRIRRLPLASLLKLQVQLQREWAAETPQDASIQIKNAALNILRDWDQELQQFVSEYTANLVTTTTACNDLDMNPDESGPVETQASGRDEGVGAACQAPGDESVKCCSS
jgi:hypothetical protein